MDTTCLFFTASRRQRRHWASLLVDRHHYNEKSRTTARSMHVSLPPECMNQTPFLVLVRRASHSICCSTTNRQHAEQMGTLCNRLPTDTTTTTTSRRRTNLAEWDAKLLGDSQVRQWPPLYSSPKEKRSRQVLRKCVKLPLPPTSQGRRLNRPTVPMEPNFQCAEVVVHGSKEACNIPPTHPINHTGLSRLDLNHLPVATCNKGKIRRVRSLIWEH